MSSNVPQTSQQRQSALDIAQTIIERVDSNRLTQVPLLHLNELPAISGLYLAADDTGSILYIGKADDLSQRCKISHHHKLPVAVERGATVLKVARVDDGLAWAVEQKLIAHYSPVLNESVSCWWDVPDVQTPDGSQRIGTLSIQGRVNGDVWLALKGEETNTQFLQRLTTHYAATNTEELQAIAPTPAAAIAVLLHSHRLLNQLMQNAAIALPEQTTQATVPTAVAPTTTPSARADDDW